MRRSYRHPYSRRARPDPLTRPPKPSWLQRERAHYTTVNQRRSYDYWTCMYWATPPWLTDEQVARMKALGAGCPDGYHLDHEVPLKGDTVCGLNVPWNLVYVPDKENLAKGNRWWPDMPMQPMDLFDTHRYQPYTLAHDPLPV